MKLSVIIPVYNEVATIRAVIESVRAAPPYEREIIVVDDASTDGTRELLKGELESLVDQVLLQERNLGKGAALRRGFAAATGEVVVVQDADLEYDPQNLTALLEPILSGKADVVFGSRFMGGQPHRVVYFWHMVGNRFLTLVSNMFTNLNLTDMETCYKAFHRDVLRRVVLKEDRFGFEPEITAKVARLGCRIYEIGISYHGRTYAEGKKIAWRDGIRAFYAICKIQSLPRAFGKLRGRDSPGTARVASTPGTGASVMHGFTVFGSDDAIQALAQLDEPTRFGHGILVGALDIECVDGETALRVDAGERDVEPMFIDRPGHSIKESDLVRRLHFHDRAAQREFMVDVDLGRE